MRYLARYRGSAALAYLSLLLSVAAQLMVPQLVQWIVDAVARGASGAATGLPGPIGPGQLQRAAPDAERAILLAGLLIVLFALARGLFAFAQSYMAERVSQSGAFDVRNAV